MVLTLHKGIEIMLVSGCRITTMIEAKFDACHLERVYVRISHATVFKTSKTFEEKGFVHNRERSGRPRILTDKNTPIALVAAILKVMAANLNFSK